MLEINKIKSVEIIDYFKNKISLIGQSNTDKRKIQIPGLSHSSTLDLFNQRGKRTQSGIFIIAWDEETNKRDD